MGAWVPPMLVPVALGGAVGACLRHWAGHGVRSRWPEHPYLATFGVNVVGSVVLGGLAAWLVSRGVGLGDAGGSGGGRGGGVGWVEGGVMIGLLGALTTYSTFATDAVRLVHGGRHWLAAAYVLGTTVVALGGAALAFVLVVRALGVGGGQAG